MSETKPSETQIQQRAYELFLERGCEPGRDIEDWLEAEKELNELAEFSAGETELTADLEPLPELEEPVLLRRQAVAARG
jgi:hypothetical protein